MTQQSLPSVPLRRQCIVRGQVQGVGFRPFVFGLAERYGLTGQVRNTPEGVCIEVQGTQKRLQDFAHDLEHALPPLARISSAVWRDIPPLAGETTFSIAASERGAGHVVLISPDTAVCADCRQDMRQGRRAGYAFTNCTNCGPRYTITRSVPYDRETTSMACFPMCARCLAEYRDPRDRRFHAQPNACPECGPQVWLVAPGAGRQGGGPGDRACKDGAPSRSADFGSNLAQAVPERRGRAALRQAARCLAAGEIAAVKGLGGFHLACDACDPESVLRLRQRKSRPHKAFALMADSLDTARELAVIGPDEEALLCSPAHPIVLCQKRDPTPGLSPHIAPDTSLLGIMLPSTPLHAVLLEEFAALRRTGGTKGKPPLPAVLVMTSGNRNGEPICLGNREAMERLRDMADVFLLHNRDILVRVDDSVVRPLPGRGPLFFRRGRGYVPLPVHLPDAPKATDAPVVLGAGAHMKNTVCLTKGDEAFVSQHIGDLDNVETATFHREAADHLIKLLQVRPGVIVRDLHPDYLSSQTAEETACRLDVPVYGLQHHFAHAYALLAEHRHTGPALVLTLDGTGAGPDATLWGGELLLVCPQNLRQERLGHLTPMRLPGGEAAIREPWRIAHALLLDLGRICAHDPPAFLPWLPRFAPVAALLPAMLEKNVNSPVSTGCGRLFDAASALLGLCLRVSYEGQAAVRLEQAQEEDRESGVLSLPCPVQKDAGSSLYALDSGTLFAAAFDALRDNAPVGAIARGFHAGLVHGLADMAWRAAQETGVRHVGLSGGCLVNATLALGLAAALEEKGLTPLLHTLLPPGDGCISCGQAAWGRQALLLKAPHPPAQSQRL